MPTIILALLIVLFKFFVKGLIALTIAFITKYGMGYETFFDVILTIIKYVCYGYVAIITVTYILLCYTLIKTYFESKKGF